MKFLADRMLGKLAKHLRILGFDVEYCADVEESEIIKMVDKSGRILLTRDTGLFARIKDKSKVYFIKSDLWRSQLKSVMKRFDISSEDIHCFSRCTVCNVLLEPVSREFVRGKVPEYTYSTHERFYTCPKCGRIYWKGTHIEHMEEEMMKLFGSVC